MTTLQERLHEAMAGPPKIKQTALARACRLTVSSVNDWTRGKTRKIEGANLMAAARFLRVSADWLATGSGVMRPAQDSPMDNKEVRKHNLAWLTKLAGGPTAFAEQVNRSQVQVSQWVGGTPVGDKLARHIEIALGHPRGWLDAPQWPTESPTETDSETTGVEPFRLAELDHATMTQAKRWVLAEETLAGPYPHDELVDQVIAVYELMQAGGGGLTTEQRMKRLKVTQARNEKAGERVGSGTG